MSKSPILAPSPRFLRRTALLPQESLPSLLERLRLLNFYRSLGMMNRICRDQLKATTRKDYVSLPKGVEIFGVLAELTQLSPEELYAASDHRFALFLTPPHLTPVEFPWIGSSSKAMLIHGLAQNRLRGISVAQYCPLCLKNAAYHRWNWIPIFSALCLEHHCLLVNRCPVCQKQLSIQEIVRHCCQSCQADLELADPVYVEGDELGLLSQQTIQAWFMSGDLIACSDKDSLPSVRPTVLYHILESLVRRLFNCQADWPFLPEPLDGLDIHSAAPVRSLHALNSEGIFYLQKAAFTALLDWPEGLYRFLDAYCGWVTHSRLLLNREQRLKPICRDWFQPSWRTGDFEFIQQAFANYRLMRHIALFVPGFG